MYSMCVCVYMFMLACGCICVSINEFVKITHIQSYPVQNKLRKLKLLPYLDKTLYPIVCVCVRISFTVDVVLSVCTNGCGV